MLSKTRLTEVLNRLLHGMGDSLFPATCQGLEHAVLRTGCILHFIDEQVSHLVVEQQRDIGRILCCSECRAGRHRNIDVIGDAVLQKQQFQFAACQWQ